MSGDLFGHSLDFAHFKNMMCVLLYNNPMHPLKDSMGIAAVMTNNWANRCNYPKKEELQMANVNITKKAIQEAFEKLLNEKTLGKINVKDITDECGINRNTFYYHYQDIPALMEEMCQFQVEQIVAEHPQLNSIEECLDAAMRKVYEKRKIVIHVYNSNNRSIYVNSLWRMCEATVTTYFDTAFSEYPLSEKDRMILIRYHKCECFGLILDWINNGIKEEYIDDIKRICKLKSGFAEILVRRSQED